MLELVERHPSEETPLFGTRRNRTHSIVSEDERIRRGDDNAELPKLRKENSTDHIIHIENHKGNGAHKACSCGNKFKSENNSSSSSAIPLVPGVAQLWKDSHRANPTVVNAVNSEVSAFSHHGSEGEDVRNTDSSDVANAVDHTSPALGDDVMVEVTSASQVHSSPAECHDEGVAVASVDTANSSGDQNVCTMSVPSHEHADSNSSMELPIRILLIANIVIEILYISAALEQLASKDKLGYALAAMLLTLIGLLGYTTELAYKSRKEKAEWRWDIGIPWFYCPIDSPPGYKCFGILSEIFGLACAILQSITAILAYVFYVTKFSPVLHHSIGHR
ncbi:hypothetical protein V6N12_048596 [Hibiscus sabdariffa]|uniref:Uncharacterized protein n=1 Tax=Hibiscus sabdariffa TaxID=183260 RepID=A0ABR2EI54_9ROSI